MPMGVGGERERRSLGAGNGERPRGSLRQSLPWGEPDLAGAGRDESEHHGVVRFEPAEHMDRRPQAV
jgi:hypothetical protein